MTTPSNQPQDTGHAFSPVVRADCKFFGEPPHLCIDVRFSNNKELDTLIAALTKLRESPPNGSDHVHLQDVALGQMRTQAALAEVTFWHPSAQRSDIENDCVKEAERALARLEDFS